MTTATILTVNDDPARDFIMWNGIADVRLLALVDKLRDQILAGLADRPPAPTDRSMDFGTRLPA